MSTDVKGNEVIRMEAYQTAKSVVPTVDPYELYLTYVNTFGVGHAFLLDAAHETMNEYRMSIIGALPVLEIQVKNGDVVVYAIEGLSTYLSEELAVHGFRTRASVIGRELVSVVEGDVLSFSTANPMRLLECIRTVIRKNAPDKQLQPFTAGLLGYIGYDAVQYLEVLPQNAEDDRQIPDVRMQWFAAITHIVDDEVIVYDSLALLQPILSEALFSELTTRVEEVRSCTVRDIPVSSRVQEGEGAPVDSEYYEDVSKNRFIQSVGKAQEYIRAGDIFQVVLSKRIRVPKTLHHYTVYERLRRINPSPYMFMAEYPDMRVFGASPEVQFRSVHGKAEMKPIAGTSKGRGATPEEDERLAAQMLADEKERAEHVMLVDLCRNDLGRVCKYGSVNVDEFMVVEPYSHVFHIVSKVTGTVRDDVSVFHALLATFPAGTLSGAPKIRAMEIIDELEPYRRGPYGGMVGMVDFDANANTAIVIRTVIEVSNTYYVQVGAGIVADSDAEQEWLECGHKAGAVLDVLGVGRK